MVLAGQYPILTLDFCPGPSGNYQVRYEDKVIYEGPVTVDIAAGTLTFGPVSL